MPFLGYHIPFYQRVVIIIYIVMIIIFFFVQTTFLWKMKLGVVFLLPFLSFCLCFENFILLLGDISTTSILAGFSFAFHSLQIPLFVVILYETSYRLHEVRAVQFCCIPFDQGSNMNQFLANISVYVVRIIAILLLVTNIFVDFEINLKSHDSIKVGRGDGR